MHVKYKKNRTNCLTHWGWVTHICVSDPTSIGSDNGLSPGRHQAIIWANAGIFLIGPLGRNFSEILIEIQTLSLKKISLTRPALERRKTLGHLRSINRNMIIHFANQSQTCQLFKIKKKKIFKLCMKRNCEKWCSNQSKVENSYRLSRASYKYTVEPLYKGHPRWWPFKRSGLSWGVK